MKRYVSPIRYAFETWATSPPREASVQRYPDDEAKFAWPGNYVEYEVQFAWEAWMEAWEQARCAYTGEGK